MANCCIAQRHEELPRHPNMLKLHHFISVSALILQICAASNQLKLIQDMLESYDRKAKPTWDNNRPVNVTFSMDLYQILELVGNILPKNVYNNKNIV